MKQQSDPFSITKLDAAERHLHFAIKQFFGGGDMVPIHTLAHATFQVTTDLLALQSKAGFLSQLKSQIVEAAHKTVVDAINSPANFLKHADRDPHNTLEFSPLLTQSILFFAGDQFRILTQKKDAMIEAYRIWFLWSNPSWLVNPADHKDLDTICRPFIGRWESYLDKVLPELDHLSTPSSKL